MPPMNSLWRSGWFRRWAKGCCAWQADSFPVTNSGAWRRIQEQTCCGARAGTPGWISTNVCLTAPISVACMPPLPTRRNRRNGIVVRAMDYRLRDVKDAEPVYRLITTILDHQQAPAKELAAPYHEPHRSCCAARRRELVEQEFFGLRMAHFAIRGLMHEAALKADQDPDRLSFLHAVRVVQRRMTRYTATAPQQRKNLHAAILDEILEERVVSSRTRINPRGVKRKMSNLPPTSAQMSAHPQDYFAKQIGIVK
jgi:hypothetical protein